MKYAKLKMCAMPEKRLTLTSWENLDLELRIN